MIGGKTALLLQVRWHQTLPVEKHLVVSLLVIFDESHLPIPRIQ